MQHTITTLRTSACYPLLFHACLLTTKSHGIDRLIIMEQRCSICSSPCARNMHQWVSEFVSILCFSLPTQHRNSSFVCRLVFLSLFIVARTSCFLHLPHIWPGSDSGICSGLAVVYLGSIPVLVLARQCCNPLPARSRSTSSTGIRTWLNCQRLGLIGLVLAIGDSPLLIITFLPEYFSGFILSAPRCLAGIARVVNDWISNS